jgi:ADP-heptose:LPS heptosyltransferase
VVNRSYAPLLEGHPDLDDIIPFDRGAVRKGVWLGAKEAGRFLARLRAEKFDLVLDLQGLLRSGIMCWATRAERRVGLADAREGARLAYTDVVPIPDPANIHAVDRYGLVAKALGCESPVGFRLPVAGHARETAARLLTGYARPWLIFAVGARWLTKRWPPRFFAELANRAMQTVGGTAIFVGGPEDGKLVEETARLIQGPCLDLTGETSLPELVGVLERADIVVANDTGPLHLAVALGRSVVAPYTCTQVRLTGPYGAFHQAVESRIWCAGSCLKECRRMECMAELTPDRLWPVLARNLERWQSSYRSA